MSGYAPLRCFPKISENKIRNFQFYNFHIEKFSLQEMKHGVTLLCLLLVQLIFTSKVGCDGAGSEKKRNILDYTDAEIERIYDQWEDHDEDKLPDDELPVWKRKETKQPGLDLSKLQSMQPDDILKATKKGKNLMMFVTVENVANPSDLELITELWQDALRQMHINAQRFIIGEDRAIFMFDDGSLAWPAKEFLLGQERCLEVNLEGKAYPSKKAGAGAASADKQEL